MTSQLQYGDDDDDLFDTSDDDEEETENELSADPPIITARNVIAAAQAAKQLHAIAGGRRVRMRPMKPSMMAKHPDVVTILLTRNDGRQVLLVRK